MWRMFKGHVLQLANVMKVVKLFGSLRNMGAALPHAESIPMHYRNRLFELDIDIGESINAIDENKKPSMDNTFAKLEYILRMSLTKESLVCHSSM